MRKIQKRIFALFSACCLALTCANGVWAEEIENEVVDEENVSLLTYFDENPNPINTENLEYISTNGEYFGAGRCSICNYMSDMDWDLNSHNCPYFGGPTNWWFPHMVKTTDLLQIRKTRGWYGDDTEPSRGYYIEKEHIIGVSTPYATYITMECNNNDATCIDDGTVTGLCLNCRQEVTLPSPNSALGHKYGEYTSNNDATCTSDGTKTAKCIRCDAVDTITDEGSMLGHTGGIATCTEKAVCERCHEPYGDSLGHSFTKYVSNNDTTCTDKGTVTAVCDRCNAADTKVNEDAIMTHAGGVATCTEPAICVFCNKIYSEPIGHDYAEYTPNNDASCVSDGTKTAKCTRCDAIDTITDEGSMLGHTGGTATCTEKSVCERCHEPYGDSLDHSFTKYISNNDTTCTNKGTVTAVCDRCDAVDTKVNDDAVMAHAGGAATCTEPPVCDFCDKTYGEPLGHEYSEYTSNNDATCTSDGTKAAKCIRCDAVDTITDEGSILDHTGGNATCTEKAVCERCHEPYGDPLGHNFTKYVPNNDTTCTDKGTVTAVCDRCDAVDTKVNDDAIMAHAGGAATCTEPAICIFCNEPYGDALGHTGGSAACIKKAVCERCLEEYGDIDPDNHLNTELVGAKETTCTENGTSGEVICKDCNEVIAESEFIPATGHKSVSSVTKATLTKSGKIVKTCSVCDKVLSTSYTYYPKTYTLSKTSYVYDGTVKLPSLTVKDSKGHVIDPKYYTVTKDSGRKLVGTYRYKIVFKNKYSGTKTVSFKINPKPSTLSSVTAGTGKMIAKWTKVTAQTTGYQIQYSTSSSFASGNKTITVSSNTSTNKTISHLTKGKKYYVRIRTYKTASDSKNYYSNWSSKKYATVF